MTRIENYYNNFYKELSIIDERSNTFKKIESFLPTLYGSETFIEGNSSTTGFLKSSNIFFDNNLQKEFVIKSFSFQDFLISLNDNLLVSRQLNILRAMN